MTLHEFIDNSAKGFTVKEEGFSVKKMMFAFVVIFMMLITYLKTDKEMLTTVIGLWLSFATSLIVTGAVEKNINATNKTKQILNTPKDDVSTEK
jgi:predicted MFS family arabinose efflux permease